MPHLFGNVDSSRPANCKIFELDTEEFNQNNCDLNIYISCKISVPYLPLKCVCFVLDASFERSYLKSPTTSDQPIECIVKCISNSFARLAHRAFRFFFILRTFSTKIEGSTERGHAGSMAFKRLANLDRPSQSSPSMLFHVSISSFSQFLLFPLFPSSFFSAPWYTEGFGAGLFRFGTSD